jgi:hypothetical protein
MTCRQLADVSAGHQLAIEVLARPSANASTIDALETYPASAQVRKTLKLTTG